MNHTNHRTCQSILRGQMATLKIFESKTARVDGFFLSRSMNFLLFLSLPCLPSPNLSTRAESKTKNPMYAIAAMVTRSTVRTVAHQPYTYIKIPNTENKITMSNTYRTSLVRLESLISSTRSKNFLNGPG